MKIGFALDIHFDERRSIVRRFGTVSTVSLENGINSVHEFEDVCEREHVDYIVFGGDTFNRSELTAAEITAVQKIEWSKIPHIFLVGNHEAMLNDLSTSSTHIFSSIPNFKIVSKPEVMKIGNCNLMFLPYCLEAERKPIRETFTDYDKLTGNKLIVSHNDIKGLQYGAFESNTGYSIEDIESSCDLFLNGHLHNGCKICKNGYNVGNLTGQNFSEDAFKYPHMFCIVDTETLNIQWFENSQALNFYKLDEIDSVDKFNSYFSKMKNNIVMTVKAYENVVSELREYIELTPQVKNKIVEYRIISIPNKDINTNALNERLESNELNSINHLEQFVTYVKDNLELSDIIIDELNEVCR